MRCAPFDSLLGISSRKNIIRLGRKTDPGPSSRRTRQTRVADGLKRKARTCLLLFLSVTTSAQADNTVNEPHFDFDIPRQRAALALTKFAEQANLTLIVPHELLEGKISNELIGRYSLQEGIEILLDGTGLEPVISNHVVLSIVAEERSADLGETMDIKRKTGLLAALASVFITGVDAQEEDTGRDKREVLQIEEIIVTGTLLRNANEGASPVFVLDREAIENTGFATTQQLVQSLPQNFGGGANEGTVFGTEANDNIGFGSSINLRGLGADSTLVLINGRRLAAVGGFGGSFTDISTIPLTAIERVEVLTDGASAVYGADAIAGVVNFILRDDYEGAETRLRYGLVTDGGIDELQVGQTLGRSWGSGNLLLSYEYYSRDRLSSEDRSFAADSDLRIFGGDDFSDAFGRPANIIDPATRQPAFAVPTGQDGTTLTPGDLLPGVVNLRNLREAIDILPDAERHNVFLTGRQELNKNLELFGEVQYGKREFNTQQRGQTRTRQTVTNANPFFVTPFPGATSIQINYNFLDDLGPRIRFGDVANYRAVLGVRYDFSNNWQAEIFGTHSKEETVSSTINTVNFFRFDEALGNNIGSATDPFPGFDPLVEGFFNPFGDGSNTPKNVIDFVRGRIDSTFEGDLSTAQVKVDGELVEMPGGGVLLAVGAEYREESFERQTLSDVTSLSPVIVDANTSSGQRDVLSVFGELYFPLVGDGNRLPGINRLEVSASVRYEDYNDFGSSTNPKIGVVWAPFQGLAFRSTYGTSFKAPKITDIDEKGQIFLAFPFVPDPLAPPPGFSSAVFLAGSNPTLTAEDSTAWTVGAQVSLLGREGLSLDFTYFNIEYDNRIETPSNPFGFLFDPDTFGTFFQRAPDDTVVQAFFDSPFFIGTPSLPASEIDVILDGRVSNFAATEVNGVDVTLSCDFGASFGYFNFGLNANYIVDFQNAFEPGAELVEFVDTVNSPVDLRLRANASWRHRGWGANMFVNHTDGYDDTLSSPARSIDSWTTIDFQLQYDTSDSFRDSWINGTVFAVSALNLFDADPPFVNNPAGLAYDPNNATALGRQVSFQITKVW